MLTARFLYYRIAMMDKISNLFKWIFSLNPVEAVVNDPTQKLLNSMRVTSKCRYNASIRLKRQSQLSFFNNSTIFGADFNSFTPKCRYTFTPPIKSFEYASDIPCCFCSGLLCDYRNCTL